MALSAMSPDEYPTDNGVAVDDTNPGSPDDVDKCTTSGGCAGARLPDGALQKIVEDMLAKGELHIIAANSGRFVVVIPTKRMCGPADTINWLNAGAGARVPYAALQKIVEDMFAKGERHKLLLGHGIKSLNVTEEDLIRHLHKETIFNPPEDIEKDTIAADTGRHPDPEDVPHEKRAGLVYVHQCRLHYQGSGQRFRFRRRMAGLTSSACIMLALVPLAVAQHAQAWVLHSVGGVNIAAAACVPALQQADGETRAYKIAAFVTWAVTFATFLALELCWRRDQRRLLLGLVLFCGIHLVGYLGEGSSITLDAVKNWGALALSLSLWIVPAWIELAGAGHVTDAMWRMRG